MAYPERPSYSQTIPEKAKVKVIDGQSYACWVDRNGKSVKALILPSGKCRRTVPGKWVGVYRNHLGKKEKTPTFTDRNHALQTAILLEKQAQAIREGRAPVGRPVGKVVLIEVLPEHIAYMRHEGFSESHIVATESLIRRVIVEHGLTTPGQVDVEQLAAGLEKDRLAGRKEGAAPFSMRTRNWWTATLKAFGTWLVNTKRADVNPFAALPLSNAEKDRRHIRRFCDPDGVGKLVAAARADGEYQGVSGTDRAALYVLALYTGLRRAALFSLTPENFTWAGSLPVSVHSPARSQKAGHDHGLPIAEPAGRELAAWLRAKPAGLPLFRTPPRSKPRTARMLRHDLTLAALPYRSPSGRVLDFHALRLSFGVMLAKAGVPLVLAQQLLQHSSPLLTANVYSLVGGELGDEVAKLPSLGPSLGANRLRSRPSEGKSDDKPKVSKTKKPHRS